jgi:hypothetical protein
MAAVVQKLPQPTREQLRRNELQVQWLISALRKMHEPHACKLDAESLAPAVEVVVGYLVTLPDGHECRLGPDRTRAEVYATQNRAALIEPIYVKRRSLPTHPAALTR